MYDKLERSKVKSEEIKDEPRIYDEIINENLGL